MFCDRGTQPSCDGGQVEEAARKVGAEESRHHPHTPARGDTGQSKARVQILSSVIIHGGLRGADVPARLGVEFDLGHRRVGGFVVVGAANGLALSREACQM